MPRKKHPSEYPLQYSEAFEQAAGGKTVMIECKGRREAVNLRNMFYTYRTVLRETEFYRATREAANKCCLRIEGNTLICERRAAPKENEALRQALEKSA